MGNPDQGDCQGFIEAHKKTEIVSEAAQLVRTMIENVRTDVGLGRQARGPFRRGRYMINPVFSTVRREPSYIVSHIATEEEGGSVTECMTFQEQVEGNASKYELRLPAASYEVQEHKDYTITVEGDAVTYTEGLPERLQRDVYPDGPFLQGVKPMDVLEEISSAS